VFSCPILYGFYQLATNSVSAKSFINDKAADLNPVIRFQKLAKKTVNPSNEFAA
jgi:hypothetical protein